MYLHFSFLRYTARQARRAHPRTNRLLEVHTQRAQKRTYYLSTEAHRSESHSPNAAGTKLDTPKKKKKSTRLPAGKTSLRRVAVEAQTGRERDASAKKDESTVTAIAVADSFDMDAVSTLLQAHGFILDPDVTRFESDQVIHTRGFNNADIFVFPSGSLVTWSLPEDIVMTLASKTLLPAARNPYVEIETEDLEFEEDPKRENSSIRGDVILLGTKLQVHGESNANTLSKIAFSSGIARSTKLAVLETALAKYFESTKTIPMLLSKGSRLPFTRRFMLQKTGELLELRAQLNHYSELTDSLPDLFWDSKHDLGLGGYYEQVGRVLDVGVRIKALNEKMDYAQEIASILRQTMSEKHSINLEWIIIILIAVEVGFELRREWKERKGGVDKSADS